MTISSASPTPPVASDAAPACGLYIHVPFCQSRCIYCDFYSTIFGRDMQRAYVDALCREMAERRGEAEHHAVPTVYFGGGTPSMLPDDALEQVLTALRSAFHVIDEAELTLEANPDDVTPERAARWRAMGINRVSLGVQSFQDAILTVLRRRHTAAEARQAVQTLVAAGLTNVSIDLIYGLPGHDLTLWRQDVAEALALPVTHLSAYALTIEEGTALAAMRTMGTVGEVDEEDSLSMYELLLDATAQAGFEHYEISNFSRPGYRSRHNGSYWRGTPYIGLGPGAHSFDGNGTRRQNLPDVKRYTAALLATPARPTPAMVERLSAAERADERIFTALRTCDGLDLHRLAADFGNDICRTVLSAAAPHIAAGRLVHDAAHDVLRLSRRGLFVSDDVMSDLMLVE